MTLIGKLVDEVAAGLDRLLDQKLASQAKRVLHLLQNQQLAKVNTTVAFRHFSDKMLCREEVLDVNTREPVDIYLFRVSFFLNRSELKVAMTLLSW